MLFNSRRDAGRILAQRLESYADKPDVLILCLPRGGVPVGFEISRRLHLPMDVFIVRKLGVPGHRELAMGAISTGGARVLNRDVIRMLGVSELDLESVTREETWELKRREKLYRENAPPAEVRGKTVILVDDGLATGATMRAAVQAVRSRGPEKVVVAVPLGARESCAEISLEADEVICAEMPEPFFGVGQWYSDFSEVTDEEVRDLLAGKGGREQNVKIAGER